MSSTVTVAPARGVRGIGLFTLIAGIILFIAGAGTWVVVQNQLADENITVSDDANYFVGRDVNGPLTAYAQAEVIQKHALEIGGGKTFAELPKDDPNRAAVQTASFLRASLFTSIVAFGVAALVMGLGVVLFFLGLALRRLAGGPAVAVETPALTSAGDLSGVPARHSRANAGPEAAQPVATSTVGESTAAVGEATPGNPTGPEDPSTGGEATPGNPTGPVAPSTVGESTPGNPSFDPLPRREPVANPGDLAVDPTPQQYPADPSSSAGPTRP